MDNASIKSHDEHCQRPCLLVKVVVGIARYLRKKFKLDITQDGTKFKMNIVRISGINSR